MKNYLLIALTFALVWSNYSCKKDSGRYDIVRDSKYKKTIIECRKETGFYMFQADMPGLSVAVYHQDKLIWSEGLGYANKELKSPARPDTKFRIGGVSKLFTGALVAKLIEEGQLNLSTPLRDYYPELPEDKGNITLTHLFSHSAGLIAPTYQDNNNQGYQTIRNGIAVFIQDTLLFQPGEYVFETDFSYDLIGAALERKTEEHFFNIIKNKITDTLHLEATEADHPTIIIDNLSQCYDKNIVARTVRATTLDSRHRAASTGMLSSALDIASLVNEYLHPRFFKKETVDQILTPFKLNNEIQLNSGLGINIVKDNRGRDLYMLSGSCKGGSAAVIAYPKFDLVVAMACNVSSEGENLPVFNVASKFIELYEPKEINSEEDESNKNTEEK